MRWSDGITDSMDMNLSKLREMVRNRRPGVLWFMGSQRVGHDLPTELNCLRGTVGNAGDEAMTKHAFVKLTFFFFFLILSFIVV